MEYSVFWEHVSAVSAFSPGVSTTTVLLDVTVPDSKTRVQEVLGGHTACECEAGC